MKNTFIIAMFVFWGFVVAVTSAGYVAKQNRLAQEAMQKTYDEKLAQAISELKKGNVVVKTVVVKQSTPSASQTTTKTLTPSSQASQVVQAPVTQAVAPVAKPALTLAAVSAHSTESDCWIVVSGKVYSVASYIPMHPGGRRRIVNECGGDATNAFDGAGHSSRAYSLLGGYLVGTLQ
jgi:cytochrome b involved in lipid metabolism